VQEFGFFPNRNQTSNVLGLGAIVIYALGLQRLQEGNRYWWLWIASLSLVCWALIIDASRAGIVLFFFGALAVHLYWWSTSRDHRQTLVALGGLVLVVILFVIDGGATLARFTKESAGFFEIARNLRFAIYRDAIQLILKSSPFGIGLGNFWPVFAIHRHYSFNTSQTAHPESDWVWGAIDLGWLGFLIALAIFCWWIFHCLPFRAGTNRVLRVAAMVCTIAFAVHGLLDVSGHRLGALLPALFLAAVAINPQIEFRRSPLVAIVFRVVGLVLLFVGVCWSTSVRQDIIPSTVRVERSLKRVDQAVDAKRYGEAVTESSHALAIAPLEWIFYFRRGVGEAATFQSQSLVRRDFAIACYLLPNWPELYLKEGEVWLGIGDPDEAVQIWEEGMRRFPENATALYSDMFGAVRSDPDLRERWRQLADDNKDRVLAFLAVADQTEFELELQQLLAADDQLRAFDVNRLKRLFALWFQKGDKLWLADILRQHPDWQKIAWPQLARAFAEYQDYRQAFETASNFLPAPEPPNSGGETDSQPRSGFQTNSDYATAGLAVVFAQSREGKTDDALTSLLAVKALPTAPKNVAVLEARLWAQKKEWKRAWQAIEPLVPAL
jgi:tetratricopeptide (TPR) repeat protein